LIFFFIAGRTNSDWNFALAEKRAARRDIFIAAVAGSLSQDTNKN